MSPMAFPRILLASCVFSLLLPTRAVAEGTWREIRSPHFRVLTDGSESSGRNVAFEFEQMRHVFATLFKRDDIEGGAPLTIVAARDSYTWSKLEPGLWKAQGDKIAGEFHRGWEKQFADIRLDTWRDQNQVVIYHEYTHSILHANTHWLPNWLDEGLAEFYGYTRFEDKRTLIGAPSLRMHVLRTGRLMPVEKVLASNEHSPEFHDEQRMQLLYAQSWAMVHYMIFGSGMGTGQKMGQFIHKIQDREPQEKAFVEVFGDYAPFEEGLDRYVNRFSFTAGVIPPDERIDLKTFPVRELTPAEVKYELGCFHIGTHDRAAGRAMVEEALKMDPKLAGAHEELAYLDFEQGKDTAAQAEWKQAVELDPKLPRSNYALAMSGKPLAGQTPEELRTTQTRLRHVTELAPNFAPPYVQLALIEWRLGYLQQAFKDAHQAEALEPSRAGYRILTGHILLQGNQPAMAADYSRYVALHWYGPDHDEAVDLWNAVPPARQGEGTAPVLDMPPGVTVVRGRLTEVACSTKPGEKLSLTVQPFAPAGAGPLVLTGAERFMSGWSDTLWWGSDHFSMCHHLVGYPVVVAYKPAGDKGSEFVDVEFRDDLPAPTPPPAPVQAQTAPKPGAAASAENALPQP